MVGLFSRSKQRQVEELVAVANSNKILGSDNQMIKIPDINYYCPLEEKAIVSAP
jgi:hypothetical protein